MNRIFVCVLAALLAPLCFGQVQIQGPAIVQGGPAVTNNPAGSANQAQVNNGAGAFGAVPVTMDGSGNIATSGAYSGSTGTFSGFLKGQAIAAIGYATGYGNGTSNGIATCTSTRGAASTCVADPSYPNTEFFSGGGIQSASKSQVIDYRNGVSEFYFHNPGNSLYVNKQTANTGALITDAVQGAPTGTTGQISSSNNYLDIEDNDRAPCYSLGNGGFGQNGWCVGIDIAVNKTSLSQGISEPFIANQTKAGVGDNANVFYNTNYGGAVAPADQGNNIIQASGGEASTTLTGTVATGGGGSGATTLTVNCSTDCSNPGYGRILIDLQNVIDSGNVTAHTAPSGNTPGNFTLDHTVTASTAWGTLNGNCSPPNSTTYGLLPASTFTCNVTMTSGTFANGDTVCFGGNYYETAVLTAATSTSITAIINRPHGSGTWVMANGPCNQLIDFTQNDVTGSPTMHYPFPIIGATSTTTLQYAWFFKGVGQTTIGSAVPVTGNFGSVLVEQTSASTLSNTGGLVTFTASGVNTINHPEYYQGSTVVFSGATNSAFNGNCTNATLAQTYNGTTQIQCSQSGSTGQTSTSATVAPIGQYGSTAYNTYYGAELLSALDSNSPPKVCASNVCTFTVTPNKAAWANGDAIELTHHWAHVGIGVFGTYNLYNPMASPEGFYNATVAGQGIAGGSLTQLSAGYRVTEWNNQNASSMYQGGGGLLIPPTGLLVLGDWNSILNVQHAPGPNGAAAISIGCPYTAAGCNDLNYTYGGLRMWANNSFTAYGGLDYRAPFNELTLVGNLAFGTANLPGFTLNGAMTLASLTAPTSMTITPRTTGGSLADGTYYYYWYPCNAAGCQAHATEQTCVVSGGGGAGSCDFQVNRTQGATGYKICGRSTSGAELLMVTLNGTDTVTWKDNGTVTPSGACSSSDTSRPVLDGAQFVSYNSAGTNNNFRLQAPAGMGSTITDYMPEDTTNALALVNEPTSATVVGDISTYNSTTGQIHDSGTLLSNLPIKIANGTATMTTAAIAAGACGSTVSPTAASVATTDTIQWSYNAAVGANPGVLIVNAWPTSGAVNFAYCNPTAASVTPTAATLNWRVTR